MAHSEPMTKLGRYDHAAIESRWQEYWAANSTFKTLNPGDSGFKTDRPKYYILDFFPYPSGSGLHVGHPLGYCATDIIARYKRMCGFNVLHPMGFDAFGLPAEQYAIEHNVHPAITTKRNSDRYREQLKMFGFSYDWDREVSTTDPNFYKFTQWIFLRLFDSWYDEQMRWSGHDGSEIVGRARPIAELRAELEAGRWGVDANSSVVRLNGVVGRREWSVLSDEQQREVLDRARLAYVDEIPVNWCPELGTVLSNEEVTNDGLSDRGNHPVYRRPLRQWMLRITKYADRLLLDLGELDWPEPIKLMQRNWIGRSTGAEVVFPLADYWRIDDGRWVCTDNNVDSSEPRSCTNFPHAIRVYTTRPGTLFGATYMVLAPEHELVAKIATADCKDAVNAYASAASRRSELDRASGTKEKTGVFTGAYAINPVNGQRVAIWVADYVLMSYGTGAIMAVPGGDARDFEFACQFDLPIVAVVKPPNAWIERRLTEMASSVDAAAAAGFRQVAKEFPELAAEVAACQERSANLGNAMLEALRERGGAAAMVNHYLEHPRSWGVSFPDAGHATHSPGVAATVEVPGGACVLDGLTTDDAKSRIIDWLEEHGLGRAAVNYKIRDWIFSRQKYWGEPFPVLHGPNGTTAVALNELPVELPEVQDFKPTIAAADVEKLPEPPLGRAKEWVTVERDGVSYRRDLNTMPQWAGSCWYYLRFLDPQNREALCSSDAEQYWMPVDLYVGGAEHAVLHLLYARFWHKVLYDLGHVTTREPFYKLFNQGMIQSFAYRDARGLIVGPDRVTKQADDSYVLTETKKPVERIVAKMSKALRNVVNPDEIIKDWGADTFRFYEMYMGPLEASKPWNTRDVPGLHKLCQRIWRLVVDEHTGALASALCDDEPDADCRRMLHKTIKRVTVDVEQIKLNTAITGLFDFVNFMTPLERRPRQAIESFVLLVAPFAPHLAEELWNRLGHTSSLAYEAWPEYDDAWAVDDEVEIGVQVNGKVKARVMVAADADEESVRCAALEHDRVAESVEGKTIHKVIVVKGRLVNIIAR